MATKKIVMCDSNVFFDYFHGNIHLNTELDLIGFGQLAMSVVSVVEAYYGMRKREKRKTQETIRKFDIYHIDKEISRKFSQLMLAYPSGRIALPDALIAATSLVYNIELFTYNRKDFDFIDGIQLYKPKFYKQI